VITPFHVFMISIGLNILFVFIFALYPGAINIAIAKLLGRGYIIELGKDRKIRIKSGKKDINSFRTKEGIYEYEFEDIYLFNGSPAGVWFEAYNKAIRPKVMPLLRDLRKLGIKTYDEFKFIMTAPLEEIKKVLSSHPDPEALELVKKIRDEEWLLDSVEYIKADALLDFLEEKNPITEKAIIEREIEKERRKYRNTILNMMPYVILFLMIIFGVIIAWKLLMVSTGGGAAVGGVPKPPITIR